MTKAEIKTKPTAVDVTAFIDAVADEKQRADAHKLAQMMTRLTGHAPKMWGPSIIGFGPRKGQTVLYITDGFAGHADLMAKLGKYKTGKSCLYIKRLSDVDAAVLEQLCAQSLSYMGAKYPE